MCAAHVATAQVSQASKPPAFTPVKFSDLRFEEDWTDIALLEPPTNHRFPGIKNQDLGGGWTASYGAQFRYRVQYEDNRNLMNTDPNRNSFSLYRTRVHADVRHAESGWRVFIEGLDARNSGNTLPPAPIDRQELDLENAFIEKDLGGTAVRLGRMELQEGAQRLISPLDWGNTRRKFQGGLVRFKGMHSTTDVFAVKPVPVDVHENDSTDASVLFGGVYTTIKTEAGDTYDIFGLALSEEDSVFTASNGTMGDRDLYTLGGRYAGKRDATDFELWGATQFGDQAGNDIEAYAWEARVGQTFADTTFTPRVGLDLLYASGDDDPTDNETGTFNQLFPLGHAYLGYIDLVGRQNIIDISPNVTAKLDARTTARVAWHDFTLAESEDALYNAGGGATFNDPSGNASKDVGQELDVSVGYFPELLGPHSHVLVGWSKFWAGKHEQDLGGDGNAQLLYFQYTLTF